MKTFCTGFAIDPKAAMILLLRKSTLHKSKGLHFMHGKLNGIGGEVDIDEDPRDAMVREFLEETGRETKASDWELYHIETQKGFATIYFYVNVTLPATELTRIAQVIKSNKDRKKNPEYLNAVILSQLVHQDALYNLLYLIPMAFAWVEYPKRRWVI